jgi:hypothetical protein
LFAGVWTTGSPRDKEIQTATSMLELQIVTVGAQRKHNLGRCNKIKAIHPVKYVVDTSGVEVNGLKDNERSICAGE